MVFGVLVACSFVRHSSCRPGCILRIRGRYLQKEATARGESLSRTHSHTICELEKRVRSLQRDLDVEARASEETRRFLQRKQESLARDAQAWKQRWKAEVEEDDQLEKLKAERAVGLAKLCEYRERYRKEMARIAQEKLEAEAEARKRQEDERNASAATKACSPPWIPATRTPHGRSARLPFQRPL